MSAPALHYALRAKSLVVLCGSILYFGVVWVRFPRPQAQADARAALEKANAALADATAAAEASAAVAAAESCSSGSQDSIPSNTICVRRVARLSES